jgi:prostaglandin-H2 D-isomerase / glutathione transferase
LVKGPLTLYLTWLQTQLRARGGRYFADQRLTIADLKVFVMVRWLNSGRLDHVPADLVARVAPDLLAHLALVAETPAIKQG